MPVAKGAGYVLSSVNQKKKLKKKESQTTIEAAGLNERDANLTLEAKRQRREEKRKRRGCRHCRRHHDVRKNPIDCSSNMYVKCIGCDKVLAFCPPEPDVIPPRHVIRSCCVDFKGKLSKVLL